jgi:hemoglobin-like flavoprotein
VETENEIATNAAVGAMSKKPMHTETDITQIQIELVRSSFAQVARIADASGALFYRRLFELDSTLRSLFRGDLQEQGRKLIQMLGIAVAWLDRPDMLVPTIEALGRRHEIYGVKPRDYDTGGKALLLTLAEGLGDEFTPEVRDAWIAVFELISSAMQRQSLVA